jgi:hypothetical protein
MTSVQGCRIWFFYQAMDGEMINLASSCEIGIRIVENLLFQILPKDSSYLSFKRHCEDFSIVS